MNKIYDQGLGHTPSTDNVCCGCAIANAYEKLTGRTLRLSEIYAYYEQIGIDYDTAKFKKSEKWGNTSPNMKKLLTAMHDAPMGGISVESFKPMWTAKENPTPALRVIWEQARSRIGESGIVFVLKSGFKVDKLARIYAPTKKSTSSHAMALLGTVSPTSTKEDLFYLEDSKGAQYGEKGFAYLNLLDLPQLVTEIWEIKFKPRAKRKTSR